MVPMYITKSIGTFPEGLRTIQEQLVNFINAKREQPYIF